MASTLLILAAGVLAAGPPLAIEPFDPRAVRPEGGLVGAQVESAAADYLRIPDDDLLRGFRRRAGRPAPGAEMGGWYSSDTFHPFGQFLSGLARLHAATGDPACRAKAEALLQGWAECIEPDGFFFYSRTPNAPHYIYDKMVGGLADLVVHCGSRLAAESLARITTWAEKHLDRANVYAVDLDHGPTEWYTLSENLYRAADATGDPRYRDFARAWHYDEYWSLFARRADPFGDRGGGRRTGAYHAYSHVNTLGGAARAYLAGGDRRHLDAIVNAHDFLVATQCYATGGFGPDERLLPPLDRRAKVDFTHNWAETQCGSFAVFKLCKDLLTITGEARFGDWAERMAYNGLLASIPMTPDGRVFYYSDYHPMGGVKRPFSAPWSCCTGTRPMAAADLPGLIYFRSPDALLVNLFVPSSVRWDRPEGALTARQRTRFPEEESTEVALEMAAPATFGLKFRVPGWLAGPIEARVNGEVVPAPADAHGWATVRREWRDGDKLTLRLPMRFEARPLDGLAPFPAAITRGPVVLAARLEGKNPGEVLLAPDLARALVPSGPGPSTYRAGPVEFRPFASFGEGEPYVLYLDPNRHPFAAARFLGPGWRDAGEFRYDDRPGDSFEFPFRGTGVRWIARRFDDAGTAEVRVDGRPLGKVELYDPARGRPFGWVAKGLPAGEHRLTVTILDEKPARSSGRFVNVIGFEVIR